MTAMHATDLVREALVLTLLVAGPVLVVALIVSLAVSLVQAFTQIQDQAVLFVPRLIAMAVALLLVLPWMIHRLMEFTQRMLGGM